MFSISSDLIQSGKMIFGRFIAGQTIAEGGQAVIAEGSDTINNQPVIIKARKKSNSTVDDDIQRQFFLQESNIKICSPYLVEPITGDENFIVFPKIDAKDLEGWIMEGYRYSINEIESIAVSICNALSDLHANNIIHRDVKPTNILYNSTTNDVRLIDLGSVYIPGITRSDKIVGSPMYTAPELIEGCQPAPCSDLFGLGCTMYWLLTGLDAFDAQTPEEAYQQILHKEPVSVANYNQSVPDLTRQTVGLLLEKDPCKRFSSALEAASFLSGKTEQLTLKPFGDLATYCLACGGKNVRNGKCNYCGGNMLSKIVLKVMTPDLRQRIFSLPVGYYTIGRDQLQRNNMLISSQHCRFEVSGDGQILIQDNNSLNKTYVNQQFAFTPTPVRPNDVIEIADLTVFVVESH